MRRRSFLTGLGTSAGAVLAGCVETLAGGVAGGADGVAVRNVTRHQGAVPVNFLTVQPTESSDDFREKQFEALSTTARRAFVNALANHVFFSWESADVPSDGLLRTIVHFRGELYRPSIHEFSYSRTFELPGSGESPVELTAERAGDDVRLRLENTGENTVEIVHPEPPSFGVLVGFTPSNSVFLPHDAYHTNDDIVASDGVAYWRPFDVYAEVFDPVSLPASREALRPGRTNALESTYVVPDELTAEHTVHVQLPLIVDSVYSIFTWDLLDIV